MAIAGHRRDLAQIEAGLNHVDPRIRIAALSAAKRANALDSARLKAFFFDDDPDVRYHAIKLTACHPNGADLAKEILKFIFEPTNNRLESGPQTAPKPQTETVGGTTTSPEIESKLAEVAAFALGELRLEQPMLDAVIAALEGQARNHPDSLCREAAVAGLGALGGGLSTILAATEDVATVRRRAVIALAPFEGPEVTEALQRALEDRDWQVRQGAEDLLD